MARGKIKWFSENKGFGYIQRFDEGDEVFVHYSVIDMQGYKYLEPGTEVEFEFVVGEKGPQATKVRKV